ncbi:hypothetical protein [Candidatus Methylacidithermus pantelleriae]|uniref:hypothetical protein n=1 Tax=Candidatus Methylacidithermus pantelleriae TaxID=2744239 RepID=UPI001BD2B13D|nr:hypothetical protein [Candidatus Methylacidithermus pantelleriae]
MPIATEQLPTGWVIVHMESSQPNGMGLSCAGVQVPMTQWIERDNGLGFSKLALKQILGNP